LGFGKFSRIVFGVLKIVFKFREIACILVEESRVDVVFETVVSHARESFLQSIEFRFEFVPLLIAMDDLLVFCYVFSFLCDQIIQLLLRKCFSDRKFSDLKWLFFFSG
jgi:hypothetical protein